MAAADEVSLVPSASPSPPLGVPFLLVLLPSKSLILECSFPRQNTSFPVLSIPLHVLTSEKEPFLEEWER